MYRHKPNKIIIETTIYKLGFCLSVTTADFVVATGVPVTAIDTVGVPVTEGSVA